jgi:hypothetical protein
VILDAVGWAACGADCSALPILRRVHRSSRDYDCRFSPSWSGQGNEIVFADDTKTGACGITVPAPWHLLRAVDLQLMSTTISLVLGQMQINVLKGR